MRERFGKFHVHSDGLNYRGSEQSQRHTAAVNRFIGRSSISLIKAAPVVWKRDIPDRPLSRYCSVSRVNPHNHHHTRIFSPGIGAARRGHRGMGRIFVTHGSAAKAPRASAKPQHTGRRDAAFSSSGDVPQTLTRPIWASQCRTEMRLQPCTILRRRSGMFAEWYDGCYNWTWDCASLVVVKAGSVAGGELPFHNEAPPQS